MLFPPDALICRLMSGGCRVNLNRTFCDQHKRKGALFTFNRSVNNPVDLTDVTCGGFRICMEYRELCARRDLLKIHFKRYLSDILMALTVQLIT